jgi:hypothetical protein
MGTLGNGNHFQTMKSLTEKYKIPNSAAREILLKAEDKGFHQVHDKNITVSYNRKSGFTVHAEEEEEE